MLEPNLFNTILIFPILNLLVAFYKLFVLIKVPGALGLAILSLTALIRLILHPFFTQQMNTTKKMQELKPHLDILSQKHKKDPKKLQQEQMRLYQQAGINPMAGCLFMVVQIPVFIGLYNTLSLFLSHGNSGKIIVAINKALYLPFLHITAIDPYFFGFNLGISPQKAGHWYYLILPVVTAILQYFQASMSIVVPTKELIKPSSDKKDEKKNNSQDFQKAMNMQMRYFFPLMIGYFSYTLPAGLSLYWNIFSLFSIIQYKGLKPKKEARSSK